MDNFQTRSTADGWQTITPRQAIARVQELAASMHGPLGIVHFEFIPLPEDADTKANWDLAFRAAPTDPGFSSGHREIAIRRAIADVRAAYPMIRWP